MPLHMPLHQMVRPSARWRAGWHFESMDPADLGIAFEKAQIQIQMCHAVQFLTDGFV